jgi:hypothetical protein
VRIACRRNLANVGPSLANWGEGAADETECQRAAQNYKQQPSNTGGFFGGAMKREVKLEAAYLDEKNKIYFALMNKDRPNCRKNGKGVWVSNKPGRVVK